MIDEKNLIEAINCKMGEIKSDKEKCEVISGFADIVLEIYDDILYFVKDQPKVGEWISCSEILPKDADMRFYMCVVENHEEDLPMFCQYEEEYGFGFWNDIYDSETLGFVDTEFKTNEELGFEKVIAWQPLPEPYKPKGDE